MNRASINTKPWKVINTYRGDTTYSPLRSAQNWAGSQPGQWLRDQIISAYDGGDGFCNVLVNRMNGDAPGDNSVLSTVSWPAMTSTQRAGITAYVSPLIASMPEGFLFAAYGGMRVPDHLSASNPCIGDATDADVGVCPTDVEAIIPNLGDSDHEDYFHDALDPWVDAGLNVVMGDNMSVDAAIDAAVALFTAFGDDFFDSPVLVFSEAFPNESHEPDADFIEDMPYITRWRGMRSHIYDVTSGDLAGVPVEWIIDGKAVWCVVWLDDDERFDREKDPGHAAYSPTAKLATREDMRELMRSGYRLASSVASLDAAILDLARCPEPGGITATMAGDDALISWDEVTDVEDDGETEKLTDDYEVYRSASPAGPFTLIDTTDSTTYSDTEAGGGWYYRVCAYNEYNARSSPSGVVSPEGAIVYSADRTAGVDEDSRVAEVRERDHLSLSPKLFDKDPNAVLDYSIDWSTWPLQTGETISTSTWTAGETGAPTIGAHSIDGTTTVVWLSGGTVGSTYSVVNRIITNQGRTEERTLLVRVVER